MGQTINFSVSARKVRNVPFFLPQNAAGSSLAAGQATAGPGGISTAPTILDRGFAVGGGSLATKIDGTVALWSGTYLSVMAKIAGGATVTGQLTLLFSDFQESIAGVPIANTTELFSIMLPAEDFPGVLVPAGATAWTVIRNYELGHARFVLPVLTNVGSGASGAWRLYYCVHDRMW